MRNVAAEVAVIGAGPAGLCAAYQARSAGADVLLIDENKLPGGQLFKQIHKFFGSGEHQAGVRGFDIAKALLTRVAESGVRVKLDSLVYGIQPDKSMGLLDAEENCLLRAEKVVIAAGAKENYTPFAGSTLPGVIGAGAAQTMIHINRVLPGKRVVMVGAGNVGLIVSYQLLQAGAEVAAVVEAAPRIGGYGVHAAKIRRAGVPIYVGHTISRAYGGTDGGGDCGAGAGGVEHVEIVRLDENWRPVAGSEFTLDADTVCLAVGLSPMTELIWMAGCRFEYIPAFGGHVPLHDHNMETTVGGLYVAGDVTGVEEASTAMEEGGLAGVAAAEALGYLSASAAARKKAEIAARLNSLREGPFGDARRAAKEKQLAAMARFCSCEAERGAV
ncbi:MAG: NAD(P)/FAD-dependent oxidoreductase [Clostridiales bacterium]|jgi:NADPH-dependent 2,4-dienoyl-CoA reductase/sulfur reductase-like enzyme|nr:NAD(P)/FAD-dependent oxidoreductase [Clostridiales bacterium]